VFFGSFGRLSKAAKAELGFLAKDICRECAATVRHRALRCRVCGTLFPTSDFQSLVLAVFALVTFVLAVLFMALR
jgi:ribosomal protein L40E